MSSAAATIEAPRSWGLKRVLSLLLKGLVAVICGAAVAVIAGGSLPSILGFRPMVVTSGSMTPGIGVGDVVLLKDIPADRIAIGDVVTFRQQDGTGMTTHRVIAVKEMPDGSPWLQTQGDANDFPDPDLTPADAVYGEVRMTIPNVGPLLLAASKPTGKLLLLGLPALLLAIGAFVGFLSALRSHRNPGREQETATPEPVVTPEPVARPAAAASTFAFRPERGRSRRARKGEQEQTAPAPRPAVRPAMAPKTYVVLPASGVSGQEASRPAVRATMRPTTFDPSATIHPETHEHASSPVPS